MKATDVTIRNCGEWTERRTEAVPVGDDASDSGLSVRVTLGDVEDGELNTDTAGVVIALPGFNSGPTEDDELLTISSPKVAHRLAVALHQAADTLLYFQTKGQLPNA